MKNCCDLGAPVFLAITETKSLLKMNFLKYCIKANTQSFSEGYHNPETQIIRSVQVKMCKCLMGESLSLWGQMGWESSGNGKFISSYLI